MWHQNCPSKARSSSTPNIGSKALLQNQQREERKGAKFSYKWISPYIIKTITKTGFCTSLKQGNKQGKALRKKCNVSLLKPFFSEDTTENDKHWQLQKKQS